jgi:hypothetical protein
VYNLKYLGRFQLTGIDFQAGNSEGLKENGVIKGRFKRLQLAADGTGGFYPGLGPIPSRGAGLVK